MNILALSSSFHNPFPSKQNFRDIWMKRVEHLKGFLSFSSEIWVAFSWSEPMVKVAILSCNEDSGISLVVILNFFFWIHMAMSTVNCQDDWYDGRPKGRQMSIFLSDVKTNNLESGVDWQVGDVKRNRRLSLANFGKYHICKRGLSTSSCLGNGNSPHILTLPKELI